jgi:hypothetical protein
MDAGEPTSRLLESDSPRSGPQPTTRLRSERVARSRRRPSPLVTGQALTLLHRIKPGRKQALREYLDWLGTNIGHAPDFDFESLTLVHFMRWVVIDDPDDVDGGTLMFESNHDETSAAHLRELLERAAPALHRIYGHCAGYPAVGDALDPADLQAVVGFLDEHAIDYEAFHRANHAKSASRIRDESAARDAIQLFLNARRREPGWSARSAGQKYDEIWQHVEQSGLLTPLLEPQPPAPASSSLAWISRLALVVLPLSPLLLLAAPGLAAALRSKELSDRPAPPGFPPAWVRKLAEREDFQVQNQLTHVVAVKPGWLRQVLLRAVLRTINLLARYEYNQGALGGITTIHYARWVLIEGGRRLVFFSNYDGSWESYLGDFVDKAHVGLTSIWSNTEGFPRTKWLIGEGATDEDNFKAWTRSHQVPTPLWYTAYPELTVRNIRQNAKVCAGLVQKPVGAEALAAWLACL